MDSIHTPPAFNPLTTDIRPDRFAECLATAPTPCCSLPIASHSEMPLTATLKPVPQDPLLPSLFPHASTPENTLLTFDYPLPFSAVTDENSNHDQNTCSTTPQLHIPKMPLGPKSRSTSPTNFNNPDNFVSDSAATIPPPLSLDMSITDRLSPLPTRATTPAPLVKQEKVPTDVARAPQPPASKSFIRRRQRTRPSSCVKPRSNGSPSCSPTLSKSHTRRCREKVTQQFEYLLQVLPSPPHGVEVKHKAQILQYTINFFRHLLLRRATLQTEIALSSRSALRHWVSSAISAHAHNVQRGDKAPQSCVPLSAVLEPFVGLYCTKKAWRYGEVWLIEPGSNKVSLSSCVFNTDDDEFLQRLNSFATLSRSRYGTPSKVTSGIINRAIISRRPEWLNDLSSDAVVFDRAQSARKYGLTVAEAVPVMLDACRCTAVLLFADVTPHRYSTSDLNTILEYTSTLSTFYLRYANGLKCQGIANMSDDKQCALQSSQSMEGLNNISDCTISAISTKPCIAEDTVCACKAWPVAGTVLSASESSGDFFGEADFLEAHLLEQL